MKPQFKSVKHQQIRKTKTEILEHAAQNFLKGNRLFPHVWQRKYSRLLAPALATTRNKVSSNLPSYPSDSTGLDSYKGHRYQGLDGQIID
jgi:hypothetical protein